MSAETLARKDSPCRFGYQRVMTEHEDDRKEST
jgi:hypothetical protein